MGLFSSNKEPVFLKESSNAEEQIAKLKTLEYSLNSEGQSILKQDIKCLEYGIAGEKNIAFELKNSHMPMYILHDIYLEDGNFSAQIDYLVFTRKLCFIIECKNLYGDVEINNVGDFIRTTEFGGKKKKEGIYSPITQNQRHLELLKKARMENKSNFMTKFIAGALFENFHVPLVVLANPKTVLNAKFAKKEIKDRVIRADQLVKCMKEINDRSKEASSSDERTLEWAQSYLAMHKEVTKDYTKKYEAYKLVAMPNDSVKSTSTPVITPAIVENALPLEESPLFMELKAFRLNKSRTENIKPYFIYNDNQLRDLISRMPRNSEELETVSGFNEAKAKKYGNAILEILRKY